jgi:AbrB family looped-hinge helix DNA binding protein
METTKLSSKGQVVLPKAVRDALKWSPGTDLTVEKGEDFVVLRRNDRIRPTTIDEVAGMFKVDRKITLEDMERGIEKALRERWQRKG